MKKALVTGGAGFIATNLIKALLENNIKVVSLDNYSTGYLLSQGFSHLLKIHRNQLELM